MLNGVGIYKLNWQNKISLTLVKYIPYPVALVDNEFIKYSEYLNNYNIINYFHKNNIFNTTEDYYFNDDELRAEVFNKLVFNKIMIRLAKENEVNIIAEEIDYEMENIKSRLSDGDDLEKRLLSIYGISEKYFIEELLIPEILSIKLYQQYIENDAIDKEGKNNRHEKNIIAERILERIRQGEDFGEIAKKESEDDMTKEYGGDLGYFGKGEMVTEFENAAFDLNIGEVSEVVETSYGFHIIKVFDKKEGPTGDLIVQASHILIKTSNTYDQWLQSKINNARVHILIKGFEWQNGKVVASN